MSVTQLVKHIWCKPVTGKTPGFVQQMPFLNSKTTVTLQSALLKLVIQRKSTYHTCMLLQVVVHSGRSSPACNIFGCVWPPYGFKQRGMAASQACRTSRRGPRACSTDPCSRRKRCYLDDWQSEGRQQGEPRLVSCSRAQLSGMYVKLCNEQSPDQQTVT